MTREEIEAAIAGWGGDLSKTVKVRLVDSLVFDKGRAGNREADSGATETITRAAAVGWLRGGIAVLA